MLLHLLTASLAVLGECAAVLSRDAPYVVHEKRDAPPSAWLKRRDASPTESIDLRIGLQQRNLEHSHRFIAEVSDPRSPKYGQHWTPEQIIDTFGPSEDTLQAVTEWLVSSGIHPSRIRPSAGRNWLKISANIGEAQSLLKTKFAVYQHEEGREHTACESYQVPAAIRHHIDFVSPTIQFDVPMSRRPIVKRDSSPANDTADFSVEVLKGLETCWAQTRPDCLRALYNIPMNVEPAPGNSFGVVEFAPQSYGQDDLDVFWKTASPHIPAGTGPIVEQIDGGYFSKEATGAIRTESNVDLEYAISLVYPQNVTLYQIGDMFAPDHATNNNFLDAIDGTYCTYAGGDDARWDAHFPHESADNPEWVYNGTNQCGTANATSVIAISYGRNENASPESYNERECHEYMKLGLMGVSVLFSSGDTGVAGFHGECLEEDGRHTPKDAKYGRFNPMFPASCPWVTSIGGTSIKPNGSVTETEIAAYEFQSGGGFSNQFEMPEYQREAVGSYHKGVAASWYEYWFEYFTYGASQKSFLPYRDSRYNTSRTARSFPDVAMNGQYFVISIHGDFFPVSGTSASAPLLGSIITLLNGERMKQGKKTLGFLNHLFYQHPHMLNDVVEGTNPGCGTEGFTAVKGWDPLTGLGTVDYEKAKEVVLKLP